MPTVRMVGVGITMELCTYPVKRFNTRKIRLIKRTLGWMWGDDCPYSVILIYTALLATSAIPRWFFQKPAVIFV